MIVRVLGLHVSIRRLDRGLRNPNQMEVHEMAIVRRPLPFGEFTTLRSAVDRLCEDSFARRPHVSGFVGVTPLPLGLIR